MNLQILSRDVCVQGQSFALPSCGQSCPTPSDGVEGVKIYLKFGGVVVWDAVCAQTAAAAPHDARQRGNPWGQDTKRGTITFPVQLSHPLPASLPHPSQGVWSSSSSLCSLINVTLIKTQQVSYHQAVVGVVLEKEFPLQSLYLPRDFMASRFHLKHEGNTPIFHLARRRQLNSDKSRENEKSRGWESD